MVAGVADIVAAGVADVVAAGVADVVTAGAAVAKGSPSSPGEKVTNVQNPSLSVDRMQIV